MRRKSLVCLLFLFTLLCAFADSTGHAHMAKQKSIDPPHMHVKQVVALPGPGDMFAGTEKMWSFSSTNVWVQGSDLSGSVNEQFQQVTQHFDGQKWTRYTLPFYSYGNIVSSSPTSAWASGGEHWNGWRWTLYTTPSYLLFYDIESLWKEHALSAVIGDSTSKELVAFSA